MARNRKRQERADYRAGGRVAFQRGGPKGGKATTKSKEDAPKFDYRKYNEALSEVRKKGGTLTKEVRDLQWCSKIEVYKQYLIRNM